MICEPHGAAKRPEGENWEMNSLANVVAAALAEDLTPLGDISAALVPAHETQALFVARDDGVLAGCEAVVETCRQVDASITVRWSAEDGAGLAAGEQFGTLTGSLQTVLTAERTALNFLCHLSGIATLTRLYVEAAAGQCRILDTRKTTPGLRALEKAAVRAGGGHNHRGSLSEMIMLKDNHLAGVTIADAVKRARLRWPGRSVEVECDEFDQVREAIIAGADIVMLDNMNADQVRDAVRLVNGMSAEYRRPLVEVSGGVNLKTVGPLAEAGPDLISVGALTHFASALDIALHIAVG